MGFQIEQLMRNPLGFFKILVVFSAFQLLLVERCNGLRLTNMTAPAIQDPRKDMELHCRFDMGGEDLYAVKWYKDDHEFFRYTPGAEPKSIMVFRVPGVTVEQSRTRCMPDGCDLLITDLSRTLSSGAYRCEVSSEAPAFRLASQTHNVTVAALPDERPRIEGLLDSYYLGDLVIATCTSGLGDPKPVITWYVNKQQVPGKSLRESLTGSYIEDQGDRIRLKSTSTQLRLTLDKKITQNRPKTQVEITCVSSTEGMNPMVAPPLSTTKFINVVDQNQLIHNQKLHSTQSSSRINTSTTSTILLVIVFLNW